MNEMVSQNSKERVVIWLDILGFDKYIKDISSQTGIQSSEIRSRFKNIINGILLELKKTHVFNYTIGSDNWIIITSFENVYNVVYKLLNNITPYDNYNNIPLEIGVGIINISDLKQDIDLINYDDVINFIKSNIIIYYKDWYKENHNQESIKESFIVFSNDFYNKLNYYEKNNCTKLLKEDTKYYICDKLYLIKKGKLADFLNKINKNMFPFTLIEDIFISPIEYDAILNQLEKNNIVFIIGDPEIGKTYATFRILWEFYLNGFDPAYYPGSEGPERKENREKLSHLKIPNTNQIFYFEDPFGKINYEDREELRREIGNYINEVKKCSGKVIITSRKNIFEQFNLKKISVENLNDLSIEIMLNKESYDTLKMKSILLSWARYFDCMWLRDEIIKKEVVNKLTYKLFTPLSIKDFAIESRDILDLATLNNIISKKAKEIRLSFSQEITTTDNSRKLFLYICCLLKYVEIKEISGIYELLCNKFNIFYSKYQYDSYINEFEYKIIFTDSIQFTHPSYEEAIIESWLNPSDFSFIMNIIEQLENNKNPLVRGSIGNRLTTYYFNLNYKDEIKTIILKLLNDKKAITRYGIIDALLNSDNKWDVDLVKLFLDKMLSDRNGEIRSRSLLFFEKYRALYFDEAFYNSLLIRILNDKSASVRRSAIEIVFNSFLVMPDEVTKLALVKNYELLNYSGYFIHLFASMDHRHFRDELNELKSKMDVTKYEKMLTDLENRI